MAALVALWLLLPGPPAGGGAEQAITLYCASGLRAPIEQIAEAYRRERGVAVRIQYGGSNTLLSQLQIARDGDLYLPADDSYLELARGKGLINGVTIIASMKVVVGVARGNPRQVDSLDDLLSLRVAVGNPDQAATGKIVREQLRKTGEWASLRRRVQAEGVFKPTVGEVANDIAIGAVDAGIVWEATAMQYNEIDAVYLPEFSDAKADVGVGLLLSSKQSALAEDFVRYLLSAPSRAVLRATGYNPTEPSAASTNP